MYTWPGIGDTLMAMPLIQGLQQSGRKVFLLGTEGNKHFYEFLWRENIVSGFRTYQSREIGFNSCIRSRYDTLKGWDCLIFPPLNIHWFRYQPGLVSLQAGIPFLSFLLKPILRTKRFIRVEGIYANRKMRKSIEYNRMESYMECLEHRFDIPFKEEFLFLPKKVLQKAGELVQDILSHHGLYASRYVVIFPETKGRERNMPASLFSKISEWAHQREFKLVLVGGKSTNSSLQQIYSNTVDLRGNRDFLELIGLFNKSRLVFSVDGGLMHLSLASRAHTVSFWGPTVPESRIAIGHPYHHPLCRNLPFQPCFGNKISEKQYQEMFDFSSNDIAKCVQFAAN
jgi:ADP-heptose:LPS heptosyltransferase